MGEYAELKERMTRGWQTWNNESVVSYIHMPEGVGFALSFKDHKEQKYLANVLIGTPKEQGTVIPKAHMYDNSYTELELWWYGNRILVQTAVQGDDQLVLVTPLAGPCYPTTLIVKGIALWNLGGYAVRKEVQEETGSACLELYGKQKDEPVPVFLTVRDAGELFVSADTAYLSASLEGPVGISTGRAYSEEEIRAILKRGRGRFEQNRGRYKEKADCYDAMQTCQAWDTVYLPDEKTPATTVSRIWNRNWGGYVLFCWDTYFGALMQAVDNKDLAYCNAIAITNRLTRDGFVPNYTCHDGFQSNDRSQPPVGSMTVRRIYEKYREKWFLQEVYEKLVRWNDWFYENRRTSHGLMAWGSNPITPIFDHNLELYDVHDRQGAAYESGLDNSPMYDDAVFDEKQNRLLLEDVGLTGLYIKDCRELAKIACELGNTKKQSELMARTEELEENLEQLWDEKTGLYLNRREDTLEFEHRLSPFHFHALFSRKVSREHIERILAEHFYNPDEFCGEYILPSIARNDPAYPEQEYWRGRIWAPMNYLVYEALGEHGLKKEQLILAEKSEALLLKEWRECGHVHENYDPETGEGCNSPRSDKFYHWGGLLGWIALDAVGLLA